MDNFEFHSPTAIHFGKGAIENLALALTPLGKRVLMVYGGGSIKRIGLYDTVIDILNKCAMTVFELPGVDPNPRITSVREGVRLCKEHDIDVILGVGGGSAIDCAKVIAAGAKYDGDAWDLVEDWGKIKDALPNVCVLTISATGTEMNPNAVITDWERSLKQACIHDLLKPKASILDPEYTYSVSKYQTAAGTADIMSHVLEGYFHLSKGAYLQDRFSEAILKTCIRYGPIALSKPDDYEARANLMWASTMALNGVASCGAPIDFTIHPIEHELSAYYDITHGVGLAIVTPRWMEFVLSDNTVDKFAEYGINVWGISAELDRFEIAKRAIAATHDFFKSMDIPMTLAEVGIDDSKIDLMARNAAGDGMEYAYYPLTAKDVAAILRAAL